MKTAWQILLFLIITLSLLEGVLRYTGHFKTYSERVGKPYTSAYGGVMDTWFPFWRPNTTEQVSQNEFTYTYKINKYGFRGPEPTPKSSDSTKRILVLGDSFTEGMGTPADSAWPRLLETLLSNNGTKAEVINAGIAGSDPFFELTLLKYKLLELKPDYVIISVNCTDLDDVIVRGGSERFQTDGSTHYLTAPWYEPFYKHLHVVRFFCRVVLNQPLQGIFLSTKQYAQKQRQAALQIANWLHTNHTEPDRHHIKLLVVVHPVPLEAAHPVADVEYHPKPTMKLMNDSLTAYGIPTINLYNHFEQLFAKQPLANYAYPTDGHYNAQGYASFALAAFDTIKQRKLLPF